MDVKGAWPAAIHGKGDFDDGKRLQSETATSCCIPTSVRPRGWTSPSVYPNADTFAATAAEGISYSLDGMDSDTLSRLATKSGPLILIPYPVGTVDMG
jgi:hypothetical protein